MDRWEFRVQICPLLSALESCSSLKQALQIHAQLLLTGLHRRRLPLSKLISFLALSGPSGLRHSHLLFSRLNHPNIFIYNCMIRGYARSGSPKESVSIYKDVLREGKTKPNDFTFPFLLKACARLRAEELGLQVHCHVARSGFDSNFSIKNSLLHFYSSFEEVAHVRSLFDEITHLDVASFNIVISCCARCGHAYEALGLFRRMLNSEMMPDGFTFSALMSVCLVSGDVRIGRAIHLLALKSLEMDYADSHLKSALVDMYVRLGRMKEARYVLESIDDEKHTKAWSCMVSGYARSGDVDVARKLFDETPEKDLISWTAMISGYSQTGKYTEALELFAEMEKLGFRPDEVNIVAMLPVCSKLGALHLGKRLHHYVQEQLLSDNGILSAALVDMYAKCGCISTALDIFSQVDGRLKSLSLFNSMISGLAQHGLGERALAIFKEMEELEVTPDEITFVGALCACSHSGLMEEGRHMFDEMQVKYGIAPQIEHFGCMVDLLGRMGLLHEAYDLIQGMPMKANSVIWSSLLRSCRIYKNAEIGKLAKKRILQLNANTETGCRLLSQIFSMEQRHQDSKQVRKVMDYLPASKAFGWSYIEWNNSVHQFLPNGGGSHPLDEQIHAMLDEMSRRLRHPRLGGELEEIYSVRERKCSVLLHSENIALAYGLIHFGPGETIKITMDLRMCTVCHSSFKLFSGVFSREIVVRDKTRFHHMKNGSCSCMGHW